MFDGRPEDVVSIAEGCNRICQQAGLDHRVKDIEPSDDPELVRTFGPTLVAIASKSAADRPVRPKLTDSKTYKRLGYSPIGIDEGMRPPSTGFAKSARSTEPDAFGTTSVAPK